MVNWINLPGDSTHTVSTSDGETVKPLHEWADEVHELGGASRRTYDTTAALAAATVPAAINTIQLAGHTTRGDGGHMPLLTREASEPTYGPKLQDAASVWWFSRTRPLDIRQFGAFGSDDPDALVNENDEVTAAITAAGRQGIPLYIPGAHYQIDATIFLNSALPINLYIEGDRAARPIIHGAQLLSNTASQSYILRLERTTFDVEDGVITLLAAITPGQKEIRLSSTTSLRAGMLMAINSATLEWYYQAGELRGEMHRIGRVIDSEWIELDDFTRDAYAATSDTKIKAWTPNELVIEHIGLKVLPPSVDAASHSPRPLWLDCFYKPRMNSCTFEGGTFFGVANHRSYRGRFDDIEIFGVGPADAEDDAEGASYNWQERSSFGTVLTNLKTWGGRAGVDLNSRTGGGPVRDFLLDGFTITGGGAGAVGSEYFPGATGALAPMQNRGFSSHGPAENVRIRNGTISNVQTGIRIRSRDTHVSGVVLEGAMVDCFAVSQGVGFVANDCHYRRTDWPDKIASQALVSGYHPDFFFHINGPTSGSEWGFEGHTTVTNCTADGLVLGFVQFEGDKDIQNVTIRDNHIITHVANAATFTMFDVEGGTSVQAYRSWLCQRSNTVNWNYGGGGTLVWYDTELVLGPEEFGTDDCAVKLGADTYAIKLRDDNTARIYGAVPAGQSCVVMLDSDRATVQGLFLMTAGSATLTDFGHVGSDVEGSTAAASLAGTTGTDAKFTIGMDASGNIFMENRMGGDTNVRIKVM